MDTGKGGEAVGEGSPRRVVAGHPDGLFHALQRHAGALLVTGAQLAADADVLHVLAHAVGGSQEEHQYRARDDELDEREAAVFGLIGLAREKVDSRAMAHWTGSETRFWVLNATRVSERVVP